MVMDGPHVPDRQPALPDLIAGPDQWAFFLDLDGTLIDIAPRPQDVQCPPDLRQTLAALADATNGALAVVTGRSADFARDLLGTADLTVAGLHGAQISLPGAPLGVSAPAEQLRRVAQHVARLALPLEGVIFEDKEAAFALHYRLAPTAQAAVERIMREALVLAGPGYCLKPGKAVVELCPAAADKGAALRHLMQTPGFAGRRPFAAGDDLTDEAMFAAALALGGTALRVGEGGDRPTQAQHRVATPAGFRALLATLARDLAVRGGT